MIVFENPWISKKKPSQVDGFFFKPLSYYMVSIWQLKFRLKNLLPAKVLRNVVFDPRCRDKNLINLCIFVNSTFTQGLTN